MPGGGTPDAATGGSSAWRDVPPEGPPRWGRRQWLLLALALTPLALVVALGLLVR